MIVLACSQAVVVILVGAVLVMRGKRGWGWALVGIGAAILVMAVVALFLATRALAR